MTVLNVLGRCLKTEGVLGQGGFGTVSLVRDYSTYELFALKVIPRQISNGSMSLSNEVKTLCSLGHPNIIKVIAADVTFDQSGIPQELILMEYCPGGNLKDWLARMDSLPLNVPPMIMNQTLMKLKSMKLKSMKLKLMRQIASALAYLHSRGLVHRDLKPENVLLTSNGDIKLADFGLARKYSPLEPNYAGLVNQCYMQTVAGTPHYMAPEVFRGHYTEKSDVFSLGVLFFEIVERSIPVANGKIINGAFVPNAEPLDRPIALGSALANVDHPLIWLTFTQATPDLEDLIHMALNRYYHLRITASDMFKKIELIYLYFGGLV